MKEKTITRGTRTFKLLEDPQFVERTQYGENIFQARALNPEGDEVVVSVTEEQAASFGKLPT